MMKYFFLQMTFAWSEDINKDVTGIFNFFTKPLVFANTLVEF